MSLMEYWYMKCNFILVAALVFGFPAQSNAQVSSEGRIQYLSEQLLLGSEVSIAGATLASTYIIPEFYARRAFEPAWRGDTRIDDFIDLVGRAEEEGLAAGRGCRSAHRTPGFTGLWRLCHV